tara:strand:+ start:160 stop:1698 length:1539 start_codon:yes stop_codon:yes gene_type:complete
MSEIRANNIISENGLGAVGFSSGLTVGTGVTIGATSGIITATNFYGGGANITGIPTTGDINNLTSNIAVLGFKVAANGSLTKYNLVDQVIDEYVDNSGIDASASTNENISSGVIWGVSGNAYPTGGTVTTYSGYRVHTFTNAGNTNFVVPAAGTVDALIVAGGGGGGSYGGGGAGGFRTKASQAVTAQTYTVTVGAGGAAGPNSGTSRFGLDGDDSTVFGVTSTGGGGGGGNSYTSPDNSGRDGGSGGGGGSDNASVQVGGSGNTPSTSPSQGNNGGAGATGHPEYSGGGGGGAGGNGSASSGATGGNGGAGAQNNYKTGSNQFYAGGGGGAGYFYNGTAATGGTGGSSIGGNGNGRDNGSSNPTTPTANTGSGGGASSDSGNTAGAVGIVVIRYADTQFPAIGNLSLQSVANTASSVPTKGDLIVLIEDNAGTATLNTDIKGYISRDNGSNWSQGTLVSEGSWGANRTIVSFHNLDISGQPSGTSMKYKIETLNQDANKVTKIHATSLGWK